MTAHRRTRRHDQRHDALPLVASAVAASVTSVSIVPTATETMTTPTIPTILTTKHGHATRHRGPLVSAVVTPATNATTALVVMVPRDHEVDGGTATAVDLPIILSAIARIGWIDRSIAELG